VLLAFFKVSCPTCQFALPFLERIHQRAQPGSPRIFLVCQDDARSARDFSREFGLTMPTLVDDGRKGYAMSNAFHITHVPTLFTVEQDDRISFTTNGFSRADFQALGDRAGVAPFQPGEDVPDWRAG